MPLKIEFTDEDLPQLKVLLNRALNCWDPKYAPVWAFELDKMVADRLLKIKLEEVKP